VIDTTLRVVGGTDPHPFHQMPVFDVGPYWVEEAFGEGAPRKSMSWSTEVSHLDAGRMETAFGHQVTVSEGGNPQHNAMTSSECFFDMVRAHNFDRRLPCGWPILAKALQPGGIAMGKVFLDQPVQGGGT
jgi:hypothetical protein